MKSETKKDKLRLVEVDSEQYQILQFLRPSKGLKLKVVTKDILERGIKSFDEEFPDIAKARKAAMKAMDWKGREEEC